MYNITTIQMAGLIEKLGKLSEMDCYELEIGRTYLGHRIFFGFRYENNSIYCEALVKSCIGLEPYKSIYFSLDEVDVLKAFLKKVQIFIPSQEILNLRPTVKIRDTVPRKKQIHFKNRIDTTGMKNRIA